MAPPDAYARRRGAARPTGRWGQKNCKCPAGGERPGGWLERDATLEPKWQEGEGEREVGNTFSRLASNMI